MPFTATVVVVSEGWRLWHFDLALVNNDTNFATPHIPVDQAHLRTTFNRTPTLQATYPVTAIAVSGASNARVKEISLQSAIPLWYHIRGEYRGDRLTTFAFESQIPWEATPSVFDLGSYGKFAYAPSSLGNVYGEQKSFLKAGNPFTLTNQAIFTISDFTRESNWHPAHDMIRANLQIQSINPTKNQTFTVQYVPITGEGILGAAYQDTPDCKPQLTVEPDMRKSSRICVIVPKGAKNMKLILMGDIRAVYDTGL